MLFQIQNFLSADILMEKDKYPFNFSVVLCVETKYLGWLLDLNQQLYICILRWSNTCSVASCSSPRTFPWLCNQLRRALSLTCCLLSAPTPPFFQFVCIQLLQVIWMLKRAECSLAHGFYLALISCGGGEWFLLAPFPKNHAAESNAAPSKYSKQTFEEMFGILQIRAA